MGRTELRNIIISELRDIIDTLFIDIHAFAQTESGDITPDQSGHLEDLLQELADLITEQVWQNL